MAKRSSRRKTKKAGDDEKNSGFSTSSRKKPSRKKQSENAHSKAREAPKKKSPDSRKPGQIKSEGESVKEKSVNKEVQEKPDNESKEVQSLNQKGLHPMAAEPSTTPKSTPATTGRTIDDSNVSLCYANICRISSTPEEIALDIGLNATPFATEGVTVKLSNRIIMNHYTAKRLLAALSSSMQRHEQALGVVETDVRKRVRLSI